MLANPQTTRMIRVMEPEAFLDGPEEGPQVPWCCMGSAVETESLCPNIAAQAYCSIIPIRGVKPIHLCFSLSS